MLQEMFFPTMIFYRDLDGAEQQNNLLKQRIYHWQEQDKTGIHRSNVKRVGSWHSRLDMNKRPEYAWISEQVLDCAQHIFNALDYDPGRRPEIDNMWANINPRYAYNRSHSHPNTLWSGVYYVQTPENCGRIYFSDPRVQAQVMTPRYNPGNSRKSQLWSEVYYEAIAGRIIIFPAWLLHEVEPNMSELSGPAGNRISISFNIYQRLQ